MNIQSPASQPGLVRVISLPLLVFYGIGVTVGAGIFALTGEITGIANANAPMAFLLSGVVAGVTAVSYALLTSVYPRAAGEAFFVGKAMGVRIGQAVGVGIVVTAMTSSAAIAVAFSNYIGTIVPLPSALVIVGVMIALAVLARAGVKEALIFAALITVVEIAILIIIISFGFPLLADGSVLVESLTPPDSWAGWSAVFTGAIVAFFAYLGFEDIVNMSEEATDPTRTAPKAIFITLVLTVAMYFLVSLVAVAIPDREALISHPAPLTYMFETLSGKSGVLVSSAASIAMINGILVQVVMASRVIYGMSRDRKSNSWLASIHPTRHTPTRAIYAVTALVTVAALILPISQLARMTSMVLLSVFSLVNMSLFLIGKSEQAHSSLRRWRYWGLVAFTASGGLLIVEILSLLDGLAG